MVDGSGSWRRRVSVAVVALALLFALGTGRMLAIEFAYDHDAGGHAAIMLGGLSLRIVFDSGRDCSKPDSCAVAEAAGGKVERS